jgi:transcriptional regulator with XRE-family HTH domain
LTYECCGTIVVVSGEKALIYPGESSKEATMQFNELDNDGALLQELGGRLSRRRLEMNLTQEEVAREAGISKRTVERLEAGHSTQLTPFLRICRALDLLDRLELLLPEPVPSPIELLRFRGRERKRATGVREAPAPSTPWQWGEDKGSEGGRE